jgi:hypothetical protein
MNNIIMLALCFVAGILMRRAKLMPDNAPTTLNIFHYLYFGAGVGAVVYTRVGIKR